MVPDTVHIARDLVAYTWHTMLVCLTILIRCDNRLLILQLSFKSVLREVMGALKLLLALVISTVDELVLLISNATLYLPLVNSPAQKSAI